MRTTAEFYAYSNGKIEIRKLTIQTEKLSTKLSVNQEAKDHGSEKVVCETRKEKRFPVNNIEIVGEISCSDKVEIINISANGILINLKEQLKQSEIVRVTFLKPNTFEFFEGLARVIRVDENKDKSFMVGVHFFNLSTSEMNKLDYYIGMCDK